MAATCFHRRDLEQEMKKGKRKKDKGLLEPLPAPPHQATGDDRQHSRTWLRDICHAQSERDAVVRRTAVVQARGLQVAGEAAEPTAPQAPTRAAN